MKIEHKKLIAREILWFTAFSIFLFALIFWGSNGFSSGVGWEKSDLVWFAIAFAILYFLRATVWAIKIVFFSKKKQ